ncbi:GNAT family N-acetyltransferase [Aeromicrobium chenweiae]|uniref:GNAT family N-acetyltransferase n=1 Tax=Aeromicrobium chenweiae TaxID=2079793 RepID=A0A2S0WP04_9ACTN|nr:GNAT family N-acetyltransferase [Aeromicrobium chenweiae]AWB93041.1 GNAT family N-acetyltransferase [Aeromicrobium chenweiae]TGN34030.1 GNAT family N-acetyltransferase [Aeromicrobium chenweiae]
MTLDAALIGRRIVVRHETGGVGLTGGPEMNDVIGHVTAVDGTSVTLELRDGRAADVALSTIVTWKTVPERPLRRRRAASVDAEELTRITSRGWPAIESVPLGDWELRASGNFTGRANSVAVTGSPRVPFDEALDRVQEFYAARSMPAQAQVVVGSSHERTFVDAGWIRKAGYFGGAVVQVADLEPAYEADPEARVTGRADDEWLAHYGRVDDPAHARAVMEGPAQVGFVSIGSPVVAIGRVVVTGQWAGLAAVEVVPAARRRGLARRVVETSLAWAVEHGADKAYLQTMRSNTAAIALYAPYGFVDHHDYVYLEPAG